MMIQNIANTSTDFCINLSDVFFVSQTLCAQILQNVKSVHLKNTCESIF